MALSPVRVPRLRSFPRFPRRPPDSAASVLPSAPAGGTQQAGKVAEIQPLAKEPCHHREEGSATCVISQNPDWVMAGAKTGCHPSKTQGRRRPHLCRETRKCSGKRATKQMRSLRGHWSFAMWRRWWRQTLRVEGTARERQDPGPQTSRKTVLKSAPGLESSWRKRSPTF